MIEALFAVALGSAIPLAFGLAASQLASIDRRRAAIVAFAAAAPTIVALGLPRGPVAGALVLPWLMAAVALGLAGLLRAVDWIVAGRPRDELAGIGFGVATGLLVVAAGWAVVDRLGIRPFGFSTTIVLLTAVHFHTAGFVLTLAAVLAARARPGLLSVAALVGLIIGTPLTALGFFGLPIVNWAGALIVSLSGIAVAAATIRVASDRPEAPARVLLRVAGAALLVSMPLAAAYATGQAFGIALLDVPAMAAIHGTLNVVGFALPAMAGWTWTP